MPTTVSIFAAISIGFVGTSRPVSKSGFVTYGQGDLGVSGVALGCGTGRPPA